VTANLKEAGGKSLSLRTETAYKALVDGWCCKRNKSPITVRNLQT